jgi:sulfur relay (sulfurtransferase) DsrC/TusE family protein
MLAISLTLQWLAILTLIIATLFLKHTWRNIDKQDPADKKLPVIQDHLHTEEESTEAEKTQVKELCNTDRSRLLSNDKYCSSRSDPKVKLAAQDLHSNNISQQMESVIFLRKLFSRTDAAPSIRQVVKLKIVPKLVELLETSTLPRITFEILWILCNVFVDFLIHRFPLVRWIIM